MAVLFILAGIAMLLWGNWYVETSLEKSRAESVDKNIYIKKCHSRQFLIMKHHVR